MKKIICVLMVTVLLMTFLVGCGGYKRQLYRGVNLENYVDVGEYKGLKVDTNSTEFKKYYDSIYDTDVSENALYNELKEGTVANGDIVNLDYEGKIDGVAFEGGTAQGYDLVIGSGSFIDDFEEELIGALVGETRDVTAKFPENYGRENLNGKEAVFTCKINSIKKPMTPEEAYSKMKFDSAEDYVENITKRAVKSYILNTVCDAAKIINYPKKDNDTMTEAIFEYYVDVYKSVYNVDLEEQLIADGSSVEAFKKQISTNTLPQMMDVSMVMYYILDAENLEILESTINSQGIQQKVIAENNAVQDIVIDYLYGKAEIK